MNLRVEIVNAHFRFSTEEKVNDKGEPVEVLKDEVVVVELSPLVLSKKDFSLFLGEVNKWGVVVVTKPKQDA